MSTAVIYRRQSADRYKDELGIDRQLDVCQKLAKARGLTVVDVLTDNATSAKKRDRQGYNQLKQLMSSGQVGYVLILRIDRLMRLADELEELIKLVEQYPVKVLTAEGDIDLTTPHGRMIARILVAAAQAEIELKGERQKLANAQRAALGLPYGGKRPYGYRADLVTIEESEAAVLREMARRIIAGHGFKEVAWWANGNGHSTMMGKLWYPLNIRNTLTNKRYAGIRSYNGADYPAVWTPIFDEVTWERLQTVISSKKSKSNAPIARKYLLTGLVYCGKCGTPLNGAIKHDERHKAAPRRIYACRQVGDQRRAHGCGGIARGADPLDDWIKECVIARLDSPQLSELLASGQDSSELRELLSQRDQLQLRLDGFLDDYATGLLNRAQFSRAKNRAESDIEALQRRIDSLSSRQTLAAIPAGQTVREAWVSCGSDAWRRSLIELLVKRIVVNSGYARKPRYKGFVFDPAAIEIEWKV